MDDRLAMHSSSAFEMDIAPSSPQSSRRSTFDATSSPFAKPNFSFDTNHHNPVSVFSSTASSSSASAFPPPQPSISVPALFSSSSSNNVVAFEDSTHFHPPSPFTFSFASFSSSASASASASSLGGGRKRSRRGWDNTNDELAEHGYFFGKQQHGEEEEEEEEECEQGRPPYDREQLKAVYKRMRLMKPFHQQQQQQASLQNLVRSHSAKEEEEEEEEEAEGGVGILFSSRTLSTAPTIVQARRETEEEENGEMSVLIKTLTGKAITIRATPSYTVEQLKELLEEKSGVPASQQRIIWRGRQMADERTLAEYNVRGGSLLHLVLALRGGGGGSKDKRTKENFFSWSPSERMKT